MFYKRTVLILAPLLLGLIMAGSGFAAESFDQILEKARAKAGELAKMRKIINEEPDPNVRLAAFELMVNSGDSLMHEIAIDSGLASADKLLQSAAFKAAIMDLERLNLTLVVDKDASTEIQTASQAYLDKNGDQYLLKFDKKDSSKGTISAQYFDAQVIGTHLSYSYSGYGKGTLYLKDDNAVSGDITITNGSKIFRYVATADIR
jgi:hypothetical protein